MDKSTSKNGSKGGGFSLKKLAPLIIVVLLFASFFIFGLDKYLTFRALSENRDGLLNFVSENYLTAILLYMALYIVAVACSFPGGLLMTITGGFLFGWIVGGAATVIAATIGATILFLIAATSLGEPLRKKAGPWLKKLEGGFAENALSYLLFLRLVPAFPFWLVNIAPAFLGVNLRTYVIGTLIGIIPGTFVFAFLGVGLDSIIVEQKGKYDACMASGQAGCTLDFQISSLITTEIILSFVALGVVSLLPIVIKKVRKSKTT
ncbi:MAG: TVP38/TMEM64 family protein [Sneathiella sp.]|uniref:TVP38/TMEM64 family protein n=1 Tax=Sneathiella sp. TaxID=1964365 RepID=UPI003003385C